MRITATRNFLLNGQHVEIGTTVDVDSDTAVRLLAMGRGVAGGVDPVETAEVFPAERAIIRKVKK